MPMPRGCAAMLSWGVSGALLLLLTLTAHAIDPALRNLDESLYAEHPTEHWVLELKEGVDPHEIAARHGHELVGQVGSLKGVYLCKKKSDTVHGITHPHHHESSEIKWFENQVARQRVKRTFVPDKHRRGDGNEAQPVSDPLYPAQWHLHNGTAEPSKYHINVEKAWELNITGNGINIGIVDDGLEYTHEDLKDNYRPELSYDFNFNDPFPFPDSSRDDHGTSAAGVAAARDNSICGVGSAFRAGLAGIRLISKSSTDADEAAALSFKNDQIHIYSNSWGPVDDGKRKEGPGVLASRAIEESVRNGRRGKGSIYVWAGGNGRKSGDNCNYDGWANSRFTISIAAVDWQGGQAWYSESCSMLVASAPSSGSGRAITTTDLHGSRGTSPNDCTNKFGGTSAAAPLVAGVVALVLEANPELTWRDVQGVLITSAAPLAPDDDDWQVNGGGLKYNHKFGFGLIDSFAAVTTAKNWVLLPPAENITAFQEENKPIAQNSLVESTIEIPPVNFTVEHVDVVFKASHPSRGDLEIVLQSPFGTRSVLAEKHNDRNPNYNWRFGSIVHWGENPSGNWTLRVRDMRAGSSGMLISWTLQIHGHRS